MKMPKIVEECKQEFIRNGQDINLLTMWRKGSKNFAEFVPATLAEDFAYYCCAYHSKSQYPTIKDAAESFLLIVNQYNSLLDSGYTENEADSLLKLVM